MEQVLFGGMSVNVNGTDTLYNSPSSGYSWNATEAKRSSIVSTDGVIKNFRVKLNGSPGAGKHYDFTLMLNGNPTALTLEIADAATTGSNMVNEITVTGSDTISIECNPDNTPTARQAFWTLMFEGDTANESLILGVSDNVLNPAATEYNRVACTWVSWFGTENRRRTVVPTAGTIKNFYVKLSEDPGTAPDAYKFTVRLNGATVAQSLIVTIVANDTTGSDLAHNLVVAAGDVLTMMCEPVDTPTTTPYVSWGMTFVADTDGESVVLGGTYSSLDTAVVRFNALQPYDGQLWDTENLGYELGQVCTVKKLYVLLTVAPGAGNKYDFTIRIAGADSNVIATISDAATTGNSGALSDTVANDEYVDLECTPDDGPAASRAYWGFVARARAAPPVEEEGGLRMTLSLKGHEGWDCKTRGGKARRRVF